MFAYRINFSGNLFFVSRTKSVFRSVSFGKSLQVKYSTMKIFKNNDAMNPYAAGLSIFVSLISALTVIAMPVEIYVYGNGMIWRLETGQKYELILKFTKRELYNI